MMTKPRTKGGSSIDQAVKDVVNVNSIAFLLRQDRQKQVATAAILLRSGNDEERLMGIKLTQLLAEPSLIAFLQEKVNQRCWVRSADDLEFGGYDDLHGRALKALFELRMLDLAKTWKTELKHAKDGFVPLVWAFIRERRYEDHGIDFVKAFEVAMRLGFLHEAIASTRSELQGGEFGLLFEACERLFKRKKSPRIFEVWKKAVIAAGRY